MLRRWSLPALMVAAAAVWALSAPVAGNTQQAQATTVVTGDLSVVWGDPADGSAPRLSAEVAISVTDVVPLRFDHDPALWPQLVALQGRRVIVTGTVAGAADGGTPPLRITAVQRLPGDPSDIAGAMRAADVSGGQPWVTIACRFADSTGYTPYSIAHFQNFLLSPAYPNAPHYWAESSRSGINLDGSQVVGWFNLPNPQSYYSESATGLSRMATDCTAAADAAVNFTPFAGVNLVFNKVFVGLSCNCAFGGGRTMTLDGVTKVWRTTWMPEWASYPAVFAHEMGHGFGFPHSSGPYGQTYDSRWDVMSSMGGPQITGVGPAGQHTITYHKDMAGWIPASRIFTAGGGTSTIEMVDHSTPGSTSGFLMAKVPIAGAPGRLYTVEVRRKTGYDTSLPDSAVVLHDVLSTRGSPALVVDADNNGNPNDEGAMWRAGESFVDAARGVTIHVVAASAGSATVRITQTIDPSGLLLNDDVETDAAGWSAQSPWVRSTVSARSGSYAWTDSPGGDYTNNLNVSLISGNLNLTTASAPVLRFWHRYTFAEGDRGNVWAQPGSGAFVYLGGFSGAGAEWQEATFDLSSFVGQSQVRLYFQIVTNTSGTADGWFIDDISVTATAAAAPSISSQPVDKAVAAGASTSINVGVAGSPTPSIQWQALVPGSVAYTALTNTAPYSGVTTSTLTITGATGALNGTKYRAVATNTSGTATSDPATLSVLGSLAVQPGSLQFAATKAGTDGAVTAATGPQTVTVGLSAPATAWTATSNVTWLQILQPSGTGTGQFQVVVGNPGNIIGAQTALSGVVTITSSGATNSPLSIPVTLAVHNTGTLMSAPFGAFDTPADNATVSGSLAVTGWALDDVGIDRVEIWRDRITNDPAPPFLQTGHPANGKVFIANGTFVEGTRPDVEAIYTAMPARHRAGWGYLLLTQGFPNANGTFLLTAIAWDREGQSTVLGTKTIVVNNAASIKPFGSIDVPAYGATFSGHQFTYGWALTPNAGCTMSSGQVYMTIDSAPPMFPVTYGANRTDIAGAFPGLQDSNGAGGAVALNSLNYTNGTHQIGWLVYDSCGNGEGIGSRFFTILNSGARADARPLQRPASAASDELAAPRDLITGTGPTFGRTSLPDVPTSPETLWLVRGMGTVEAPLPAGSKVWLSQTGRIEVHATRPGVASMEGLRYEGYLVANGELRALPLGSSFDATRGSFFWQPVAGFLGTYEIRIVQLRGDTPELMWSVPVEVGPEADGALLQIDATDGVIRGWAIDPQATDGSGIGHVHAWIVQGPTGSTVQGSPRFMGAASLGKHRQDVGNRYGRQFDESGFSLALPPDMAPGQYELVVYAWSVRTGRWDAARSVVVRVK